MAQPDTYASFKDLSEKECEGKDYQRFIKQRHSNVTIIAPHGGGIEPGTSEIAKAIAGDEFTVYCFEGYKRRGNATLHVTGINFDEPSCVELVRQSQTVVAIHGCDDDHRQVYIGGLDELLKAKMIEAFQNHGYEAKGDTTAHAGQDKRNICNRSGTGKGIQLEISKKLRQAMFRSLNRTGRKEKKTDFDKFVDVVRGVLSTWDPK